MPTYISILRGINVGGQKKIQMEELKVLYERLDFEEVTTFIQSGNVIFKTEHHYQSSVLSEKIEKAIEEKYHFYVPVIIRNKDEIQLILSSNPFLKESSVNREKLHVTFLDKEPASEKIAAIHKYDFPPDRFHIKGKEVYLFCSNGYGNTKLSNNFFEKKLLVRATTRNWNTVVKLSELTNL
jgi:uncharacterized protein (DUF1697 family)